jgi:hypothetical protein
MISEPAWSKEIPNSTVCTWFYALAMLNLFVGIAGVIGSIYLTSIGKSPFGLIIFMGFVTFIAFINMWFLFLMCNRALHEEGWKNHERRYT